MNIEDDCTPSDLRRMWDRWQVTGETTKTRILKEIKVDMGKVKEFAERLDKANGKTKKGWGLMRDVARLVTKRISENELD
jgi:hypothetical protein